MLIYTQAEGRETNGGEVSTEDQGTLKIILKELADNLAANTKAIKNIGNNKPGVEKESNKERNDKV